MRRRFNATTVEEIDNGSKKKKISYNNEQNSAYIPVKFFLFDGNFKLSIFNIKHLILENTLKLFVFSF